MVSKEFARSISTGTDDVPQYPIHRLTVAQYHAMIQQGILTEDDNVELIEGWLIEKMGKNRPHSLSTKRTREKLIELVPTGWYVDSQEPITTETSEPEPDVLVVRGKAEDYPEKQPHASTVSLVVEVSESSLQFDRRDKLRIYAAAGIPSYWLLNLVDRQLEVYTEPTGAGAAATYAQRTDYAPDAEAPLLLDGAEIARVKVSALLP